MFPTLLHKVSLGRPSTFRNLTLTPILLNDGPLSPIALLGRAVGHCRRDTGLEEVGVRDRPILCRELLPQHNLHGIEMRLQPRQVVRRELGEYAIAKGG